MLKIKHFIDATACEFTKEITEDVQEIIVKNEESFIKFLEELPHVQHARSTHNKKTGERVIILVMLTDNEFSEEDIDKFRVECEDTVSFIKNLVLLENTPKLPAQAKEPQGEQDVCDEQECPTHECEQHEADELAICLEELKRTNAMMKDAIGTMSGIKDAFSTNVNLPKLQLVKAIKENTTFSLMGAKELADNIIAYAEKYNA